MYGEEFLDVVDIPFVGPQIDGPRFDDQELSPELMYGAPGPDVPGPDVPPADPAASLDAFAHFTEIEELVAKTKADQIAAIASQKEQGLLAGIGIGDNEDKVTAELESLPPEMRARVLEQLGKREGDAALSEDARDTVKRANDDVAAAEESAKKKTLAIDGAVKAAEQGDAKAIEASLDGLSPKRREEAMKKMSPEARAAAEEALEKRRERLEKLAERLEKAQHGTSATDQTDEVGIITGLTGLTENEAEELAEIYGEKFKDGDDKPRNLKKDLQAEFGEDDKEGKFIRAVFNGDKEAADEMSVDLAVSYLEDEATALVSTDEDAMNDLLRAHNKNPEAAERIATAYRKKTGKELSAACEKVMDEAELKEASANIAGDPRTANVAVLEQGNGERTARVIEEVETEPGGMEQLAKDTQDHTGKKLDQVLDGQLPDDKANAIADRVDAAQDSVTAARDKKLNEELEKLKADPDPKKFEEANKKAEEVAGKLSTALSKRHLIGNNTDVTEHLRGLDPAEVALVMQHYEKMTESLGEKKNLEDDLRAKLTGKDLKVANAALTGDKVLTAVALVQQSADNIGTDVEGWKKAMETLQTPEEREKFKAEISKHIGGKDAYDKLVKSETSSFDRDTLKAMAIVDADERAATMAQVDFTKNAYGGKLAGYQEAIGDITGDVIGESEEERARRRQAMREHDVATRLSNLGGSEDAQLDAMAGLQNEKQQKIFNQKVKDETGKSTEEVIDEEMSGHHAAAGKKFAKGEYEDAQAERMVAELDNIVDDREDAASKPFEQVRLGAAAQERIEKIPEGPAREAAIKAEKKAARESLLEKADEAARKAGHASYMDMLAKELSPAELEVAKERIADGKVSDETALFQAGDTAVGNLGKDSSKFYEIMQDKSPEEMQTLREKFEAKHPDLSFDEWVRSKATSAGQKRDFEVMLEGNYARMTPEALAAKAAKPEGQRDLIKRVKDLEAAARGGADENEYDPIGNAKRKLGNAAGNVLADEIGNAGERIDERVKAVKKLEEKLDEGKTLSAEEQEQLVTHMRYMSGDQKAYTETKTEAVNTGAEIVGAAVEVGTTALTGNTEVAAAAAGLAKMEVKGTFDPGRYGLDEQVADVVQTGMDYAGSVAGGKLEGVPGLAEFVEGAIGGAGAELGNTQNWTDAGKLVDASARSAATSGAGAVVSAATEALGGNGPKSRTATVVSKVASATAEELVTGDDSQTFKDRATNVAKSAAQDMASDAAKDYHEKHYGGDKAKQSEETPPAEEPAHEGADEDAREHDGLANEEHADDARSHDEIPHEAPAHDMQPHDAPETDAPTHDGDPKTAGPQTIDDLQSQSPEMRATNPKDLATAKTKLASGEPLGAHEMQAVIDLAVNAARQGMEREGIDIKDNAQLGGMCGPTQQRVTDILTHVLGPNAEVVTHASHFPLQAGDDPSDVRGLPGKLQSKDAGHSYTTIHLPDGRAFLVDPTFGQFAAKGNDTVGSRMVEGGGGEAGAALMKNGFVELTPEVANAYGRALTGKDADFTVDDFATPTRNEKVRKEYVEDRSAVADAKQLWDSVFETREVGSDVPVGEERAADFDMTSDKTLHPVDLDAMAAQDRGPVQKVLDAASKGLIAIDDLIGSKFLGQLFGANDASTLEQSTEKGAPANEASDAAKDTGDGLSMGRAVLQFFLPHHKQSADAIGDGVITGAGKLLEFVADKLIPGAGNVVSNLTDLAKPTLDRIPDLKQHLGKLMQALDRLNLADAGRHAKLIIGSLFPQANLIPTNGGELDLDVPLTDEDVQRAEREAKRDDEIRRQQDALEAARAELRLAKGDPEMEARIQLRIARTERELGALRDRTDDTDGNYDLRTPETREREAKTERQQEYLASLRAQLAIAEGDPIAYRGISDQIAALENETREQTLEQLRITIAEAPSSERPQLEERLKSEEEALREQRAEQEAMAAEEEARERRSA